LGTNHLIADALFEPQRTLLVTFQAPFATIVFRQKNSIRVIVNNEPVSFASIR